MLQHPTLNRANSPHHPRQMTKDAIFSRILNLSTHAEITQQKQQDPSVITLD
jgi:hypothetical protein